MSELPSWSGQALESEPRQQQMVGGGQNGQGPSPEPPRSGLMLGLLIGLSAGLILAAVGIGAYWLGRQQADDVAATTEEATGSDPAAPAEDEIASETAGDADGSTVAVDTADDVAAQDDEAGEGAPADQLGVADGQMLAPAGYVSSDPNYETRIQQATEYAVVRGGKVYLYGFATTQEDLDNSIAVTEAVMGPDGYVVERFIDPDTPEGEGAPIYVDDKVLFGFNSTELDPAVLPILDLGVLLMLQNPTAEMLIIARSDAVGSAAANLEISQLRGEAVVEYWTSQGVDRTRMTVDARGESEASEDDSPEVAALNRSVEFVVSGITNG